MAPQKIFFYFILISYQRKRISKTEKFLHTKCISENEKFAGFCFHNGQKYLIMSRWRVHCSEIIDYLLFLDVVFSSLCTHDICLSIKRHPQCKIYTRSYQPNHKSHKKIIGNSTHTRKVIKEKVFILFSFCCNFVFFIGCNVDSGNK